MMIYMLGADTRSFVILAHLKGHDKYCSICPGWTDKDALSDEGCICSGASVLLRYRDAQNS